MNRILRSPAPTSAGAVLSAAFGAACLMATAVFAQTDSEDTTSSQSQSPHEEILRQRTSRLISTSEFQAELQEANQLIGTPVYNPEGQELGVIEDIVLDGGRDRISYAVLSFGGIMGVGDKLFAVPWYYLQARTEPVQPSAQAGAAADAASPAVNVRRFVVNLDRKTLENAPGFDPRQWPNMREAGWDRSVRRYFSGLGAKAGAGAAAAAPGKTSRASDTSPAGTPAPGTPSAAPGATAGQTGPTAAGGQTGLASGAGQTESTAAASGPAAGQNQPAAASAGGATAAQRPSASRDASAAATEKKAAEAAGAGEPPDWFETLNENRFWTRRLTQIIGTDVRGPKQNTNGEIEDIIIDLREGRPVYAIISLDGIPTMQGKVAAVPWRALEVNPNRHLAHVAVSTVVLTELAFDPKESPDLANSEYAQMLHEKLDREPYWSVYGYVNGATGQPELGEAWLPGSEYNAKFEPATINTFRGEIVSIGTFRPNPDAADGLRVRVRSSDGRDVIVHAGPRRYYNQHNLRLRQGDTIDVTGSHADFDGRRIVIATTLQRGDRTISLRSREGAPNWNAQGEMSPLDQPIEPAGGGSAAGPGAGADVGAGATGSATSPDTPRERGASGAQGTSGAAGQGAGNVGEGAGPGTEKRMR